MFALDLSAGHTKLGLIREGELVAQWKLRVFEGGGARSSVPTGEGGSLPKKKAKGGEKKRGQGLRWQGHKGRPRTCWGRKSGGVRVNVVSKPRELCADHINHFGFWRERL